MPKQPDRWTLPDVRTLTEPPVVGEFCLVPTIWDDDNEVNVPIIGTRHADPELITSEEHGNLPHYHFDFRFLPVALLDKMFGELMYPNPSEAGRGWEDPEVLQRLMGRLYYDRDKLPVILRRRRCVRAMPQFPVRAMNLLTGQVYPVKVTQIVEEQCAGRRVDPENPVCPHRGFSLRGLPQDSEGRVICPGHGLCISLRTGEIVSRYEDHANER